MVDKGLYYGGYVMGTTLWDYTPPPFPHSLPHLLPPHIIDTTLE